MGFSGGEGESLFVQNKEPRILEACSQQPLSAAWKGSTGPDVGPSGPCLTSPIRKPWGTTGEPALNLGEDRVIGRSDLTCLRGLCLRSKARERNGEQVKTQECLLQNLSTLALTSPSFLVPSPGWAPAPGKAPAPIPFPLLNPGRQQRGVSEARLCGVSVLPRDTGTGQASPGFGGFMPSVVPEKDIETGEEARTPQNPNLSTYPNSFHPSVPGPWYRCRGCG